MVIPSQDYKLEQIGAGRPRALRIPNSRVLCATPYEMTP